MLCLYLSIRCKNSLSPCLNHDLKDFRIMGLKIKSSSNQENQGSDNWLPAFAVAIEAKILFASKRLQRIARPEGTATQTP